MRERMKVIPASIMIVLLLAPTYAAAYEQDTNHKEVGVEWVQKYSPCGLGNLYNTKADAEGFYNTLGGKGWTKSFNWGTSSIADNAWEKDYEKVGVGGWDTRPYPDGGVDTVDFAYFSGHGSPNAFWFGTNHDGNGWLPCRVDKSEVSWGETDLEWIVLSVCQALQYSSGGQTVFQRWNPAFKGLHQILSYDTVSYDISMGNRFAYYMTRPLFLGGPKKIKDAWFQTNKDLQPSSVWSAVLSTDKGWNDYLPGYGAVGGDGNNGWMYWERRQS